MFILKKGHQPGVYVPLRALFLVKPVSFIKQIIKNFGNDAFTWLGMSYGKKIRPDSSASPDH